MVLTLAPSKRPVAGLYSRALVAPGPPICATTEAGRYGLSAYRVKAPVRPVYDGRPWNSFFASPYSRSAWTFQSGTSSYSQRANPDRRVLAGAKLKYLPC